MARVVRPGMVTAGRVSRTGKRGEPYTAREAEVAALLHLSNRQIAEALHVSGETVRKHVSNVLRKAGVDRRAAVPDPRVTRLLAAIDDVHGRRLPNHAAGASMVELYEAREAFR